MKKSHVACGLALTASALALVIALVDSAPKRKFFVWRVEALVEATKQGNDGRQNVEKLISIAEGKYRFGACHALEGIGRIGSHASPVVKRVAMLLHCPDPFVRRQAAITLGSLGPISLPAKDLVLEVASAGDPREDTTMFCVETLARMGDLDTHTSRLLTKRLGRSDLLDEYIREALTQASSPCPQ